jgi:hypothetical protein
VKERLRIIVTGLIAQHYALAGVTWDYLQYLIGLKQMGHDVYYIEDSGEWPYTLDGGHSGDEWISTNCHRNIGYLHEILSRFGFGERWAYLFPAKSQWYGLSEKKRKALIESADLLINVSGTLDKPEHYALVKRMAYIDSDPAFTQVKVKLGDYEVHDRIKAHHVHFSFGENLPAHLHQPDVNWLPTRTPIVLDEWPVEKIAGSTFNTIMNWRSYRSFVYENTDYLQKDAEFVKFLQLPWNCPKSEFEIALGGVLGTFWHHPPRHLEQVLSPEDLLLISTPDKLLSKYGWRVVDPGIQCGTIDTYRDYIVKSRAEWSVAKGGYVVSRPGWFSCRSACYLAAGRPVVVQDTGFDSVLPVGEGILPFNSLEESVQAVEQVEGHYALHSKRAREIAEAYFDATKVLGTLIERS